jgi:hypothetical protein
LALSVQAAIRSCSAFFLAGLAASVFLERLDAPLWLLFLTMVLFILVGVLYDRLVSSRPRIAGFVVGAIAYLGLAVYVVANHATSSDVPVHVTRYYVHPFVENKTVQVNLFYRNDAQSLKLSITYFLSVAGEPPAGRNPNWMSAVDQVWSQTIDGPPAEKIIPIEMTVPKGEFFFTLVGPSLTSDQFKGLSKGTGALFIVGKIRYVGDGSAGVVGFCAVTQNGQAVALCPQHNGPLPK